MLNFNNFINIRYNISLHLWNDNLISFNLICFCFLLQLWFIDRCPRNICKFAGSTMAVITKNPIKKDSIVYDIIFNIFCYLIARLFIISVYYTLILLQKII